MNDEMEYNRSEIFRDDKNISEPIEEYTFFSPQASTVYFSAESLGTSSFQDDFQLKRSFGTQTKRSFVYAMKIFEAGLGIEPTIPLTDSGIKKDALVDASEERDHKKQQKAVMYRESGTDAPKDSLIQLTSALGPEVIKKDSEQSLVQERIELNEEKFDIPIKGILKHSTVHQDKEEEGLVKSASTQSDFEQEELIILEKVPSKPSITSIKHKESGEETNQDTEETISISRSKDSLALISQKPSIIFKDSHSSKTGSKIYGDHSIKNEELQNTDIPKHMEILPKTLTHILDKSIMGESLPELVKQASFIDLRQPEVPNVASRMSKLSPTSRFSVSKQSYLATGNAFIHLVLPPDGGYGWVIVIMSFLAQVIIDGILFGLGILLPNVNKEFAVAPVFLSLLSSVQLGFYLLSGPVSSALINKMGFRPVVIMGSCLSITAIVIASYCPTFPSCLFFYSVIGGPSLSMIWTASQLIIGFYFEKYRPIANGLAVSGAGAGMIIFGVMNALLVDVVGWRNVFRLQAALLVLTLLIGITFLEVKPTKIPVVYQIDTDSDDDSDEVLHRHKYSVYMEDPLMNTSVINIQDSISEYKRKSLWSRLWRKLCICCYKKKRSSAEIDFVVKQDPIEKIDLYYTGQMLVNDSDDRLVQMQFEVKDGTTVEILAPVNKRKSIAFHLLEAQRTHEDPQKRHMTYQQVKSYKITKYPFLYYISPKNWMSPKITKALNMLFDFRLLRNTEFKVLFLSAILFPMGFNIPFLYSRLRSEVPADVIFWITPTIGFSNFAVRIISGFLAYYYRTYTTRLCGGGMIFGGFFVFLSSFYGVNRPWFQLLYAFCYGMAPAFYSTLRALIYVRCVGLEKLTNAFGITAMGMGLGVFIGTTMAGLLNEFTYSYSAAFAVAGICIMAAGILKLVVVPMLHKRRRQKRHQSQSY